MNLQCEHFTEQFSHGYGLKSLLVVFVMRVQLVEHLCRSSFNLSARSVRRNALFQVLSKMVMLSLPDAFHIQNQPWFAPMRYAILSITAVKVLVAIWRVDHLAS